CRHARPNGDPRTPQNGRHRSEVRPHVETRIMIRTDLSSVMSALGRVVRIRLQARFELLLRSAYHRYHPDDSESANDSSFYSSAQLFHGDHRSPSPLSYWTGRFGHSTARQRTTSASGNGRYPHRDAGGGYVLVESSLRHDDVGGRASELICLRCDVDGLGVHAASGADDHPLQHEYAARTPGQS